MEKNSDQSDSFESTLTPYQKLEIKVEDAKMFFTMCLAVCYVFSTFVVCCHFTANEEAFTGYKENFIPCFATDDSDNPSSLNDHSASDISDRF